MAQNVRLFCTYVVLKVGSSSQRLVTPVLPPSPDGEGEAAARQRVPVRAGAAQEAPQHPVECAPTVMTDLQLTGDLAPPFVRNPPQPPRGYWPTLGKHL